MIFLSIGHSDVFMCSLDKFLSELIFKFSWSPIDLHILEVFVKFELVEFFFLKLLEGLLYGTFGCEVEQFVIFFIGDVFHGIITVINEDKIKGISVGAGLTLFILSLLILFITSILLSIKYLTHHPFAWEIFCLNLNVKSHSRSFGRDC